MANTIMRVVLQLVDRLKDTSSVRNLRSFQQQRNTAAVARELIEVQTGVAQAASEAEIRSHLEVLVCKHEFVRLLSAALSKGLELILQEKRKGGQVSEVAINTAEDLEFALTNLICSWVNCDMAKETNANPVAVAQQVASSGLLQTVLKTSSSATVLQHLQQHAEQQQQAQRQVTQQMSCGDIDLAVLYLTCACINVTVSVTTVWPGKILAGPLLGACVEPVAHIWHKACPIAAAYFSSSKSAAGTVMSTLQHTLLQLWLTVLGFAVRVPHRLVCDVSGRGSEIGNNAQISARMASEALHTLCLGSLGLAAYWAHSRCTEEHRLDMPPAYHNQLLEQLGMACVCQEAHAMQHILGKLFDEARELYEHGLPAAVTWRHRLDHVKQTDSNSIDRGGDSTSAVLHHQHGDSSAVSSMGTSSNSAAAVSSLGNDIDASALLTLVEFALLGNSLCSSKGVHTIAPFLGNILGRMSSAARNAVLPALVEPLFVHLAPVCVQLMQPAGLGVHIEDKAATAGAGLLDNLPGGSIGTLPYVLGTALLDVMFNDEQATSTMVAFMSQHPLAVSTAIEASVRHVQHTPDLAFSLITVGCKLAVKVCQQSGWPRDRAASNQLFSMLVTTLKVTEAYSAELGRMKVGQVTNITKCRQVMASAAHASGHMSLVLVARSLLAISRVVQYTWPSGVEEAAGTDAADSGGNTQCVLTEIADAMLLTVRGVILVGKLLADTQLAGEAAAAAQSLENLKAQQLELQQLLQVRVLRLKQQYRRNNGNATSGSGPKRSAADEFEFVQQAYADDVLLQLQQFSEAVCAQVPLPLWCCNPGCTNVQKLSELQLVSGKGCVCAKCTTARFCSRACQEQCWKELHRPVCKRIAAARQQAAGS